MHKHSQSATPLGMDFRRVRMIKVSEKPGDFKVAFDKKRSSAILYG